MSDLYEIVDPRPVAATSRYTFFLPTDADLEALDVGDLIKLIVRAIPPSEKWDAERLWIKITSLNGNRVEGTLESEPDDMPGLPKGSIINAARTDIVDTLFGNPEKESTSVEDAPREYWERCLVDQVVLDGTHKIHFIYREQPEVGSKNDEFRDSGWRIRGDMRRSTEAEIEAREAAYVALGAVLNKDDSWLELIDEPVGSAFEKDFDSNQFLREA